MPTVSEARDSAAKAGAEILAGTIADAMAAAAATYEETGQVVLPPDHRQRVEQALLAIWGEAARQAGRGVIDQFKADMPLETKADEESFFDRVVAVFAEMFGARKIEAISDTTREQVRQIVLQGQLEGQGILDIATRIREAIPSASRTRAAVIARTEAHGSSNFAVNETAKLSRRPLMKEWVSVDDHRTRDFGEGDGIVDEYSHRAMNGQKVPMDQAFQVPRRNGTTEHLMFPGDPNGSPGAVINCRCVVAYVRAE